MQCASFEPTASGFPSPRQPRASTSRPFHRCRPTQRGCRAATSARRPRHGPATIVKELASGLRSPASLKDVVISVPEAICGAGPISLVVHPAGSARLRTPRPVGWNCVELGAAVLMKGVRVRRRGGECQLAHPQDFANLLVGHQHVGLDRSPERALPGSVMVVNWTGEGCKSRFCRGLVL
eukprot:3304061-Rhodomonas_salina.1